MIRRCTTILTLLVPMMTAGLLAAPPANQPTAAQSRDAATMQRLAREFPSGVFLRKTAHYMLVYDTPHAWAESRANLLERAYANFYHVMKQAGFDPEPIDCHLVGVLFNDHRKYLAYGKQRDGLDVSLTGGYYSPRTNRIAMFNAASDPKLDKPRAQMAQLEQTIDQARARADAAAESGDSSLAQHYRGIQTHAVEQLSLMRNQFERMAGLNNISQTIHEATHQLAFNSGIQSRFVLNPFWLSEGLATSFETMMPAASTGPADDNFSRRRALTQAVGAGQLIPLATFITRVQIADANDDQRERLYGQAWGLFHFLYTTRRPALIRFMQQTAAGRGGHDAMGLTASFRQAFGPIDKLDAAWRAWLSQLR